MFRGLFGKSQPLTELIPILKSREPRIDVVFVHGLDGDPVKSWRMNEPSSWADWIETEIPTANVWSLRYRVRSTFWGGGSMSLMTRARNVLATLDGELPGRRPIFFICHSYGGLLVKQMLRTAADVTKEYQRLTKRVAGIVFFGTPNSGSVVASFIGTLKPLLQTSSAVDELQQSAPLLQELNYWFRGHAEDKGWQLRAYFETMRTFTTIVVDEASADLGLKGNHPIGIDANHVDICKPTTLDVRVKQTLAHIGAVLVRETGSSYDTMPTRRAADENAGPQHRRETKASSEPARESPKKSFESPNRSPKPDAMQSDRAETRSRRSVDDFSTIFDSMFDGTSSPTQKPAPPAALGGSGFFATRGGSRSAIDVDSSEKPGKVSLKLVTDKSGWRPCSNFGEAGTLLFGEWLATNATDDEVSVYSIRLDGLDATYSKSGASKISARMRTRVTFQLEFHPPIVSNSSRKPLAVDIIYTAGGFFSFERKTFRIRSVVFPRRD